MKLKNAVAGTRVELKQVCGNKSLLVGLRGTIVQYASDGIPEVRYDDGTTWYTHIDRLRKVK